MPTPPLRLMIIDDSVLARRMLGDAFRDVPGVELLASAPNGRIALAKLEQAVPDVCIVDLEMPDMDGIELIAQLRRRHPAVRILLHTANAEGAQARTVEALTLGATDILVKPRLASAPYEQQMLALREVLLPRLRAFQAHAAPPSPIEPPPAPRPRPRGVQRTPLALAIGISTGGPDALSHLLARLPGHFPVPILIAQHMPPGFTRALAERLDRASALTVREAEDGEAVHPGGVWIAPGGWHLAVEAQDDQVVTRLLATPPVNSCRPSVDVLVKSAAEVWGDALLTLIMTGMGSDGLDGARHTKAKGGVVLAQDRATSVVWGMPGSVAVAGLADALVPLGELPAVLEALVARRAPCP